jgi:hypothetical protein
MTLTTQQQSTNNQQPIPTASIYKQLNDAADAATNQLQRHHDTADAATNQLQRHHDTADAAIDELQQRHDAADAATNQLQRRHDAADAAINELQQLHQCCDAANAATNQLQPLQRSYNAADAADAAHIANDATYQLQQSHNAANAAMLQTTDYNNLTMQATVDEVEVVDEMVIGKKKNKVVKKKPVMGVAKVDGNRHTFPKVTKDKLVDGNIIKSHPFLEKSTEAEISFCRSLQVEKPFLAPHGTKIAAWNDFCELLNKQKDEKGNPLFDPPINQRFAKERLADYFSFVKNKIAVTPLRSGCDDEAEPCPLLTLIEDIYELNESFETDAKKKKNIAERNKLESEALKKGSLKNYTPSTKIVGSEITVDKGTPAPFAKETNSSDSSISGPGSGDGTGMGKSQRTKTSRNSMVESLNSFDAVTKRHLDIAAEKEANKKLKYALKMKLLDQKLADKIEKSKEKEARREEKRKDKELAREQEKMAREEDKKDKELAREQNKKMLDVMFALHSSAAKSPK